MPLDPHRDLILPPDETVLWRYMDFAKFVQFLETQSLWFLRADQFEDPLEGTYTDAEVEHLTALDAANGLPQRGILRGPKYMRSFAYVNCWRKGEGESLAMWDLYGKGNGVIAVKTTVGNFKMALAESQHRTFLGEVKYIDWARPYWDNNILAMCFRKDLSYQHEAEVRAVIWDPEIINRNMSGALEAARLRPDYSNAEFDPFILTKEDGEKVVSISFAPSRFITEVVIGPREKSWIQGLIRKILTRYGLEKIKIEVSNRLTPR